MSAPIETPAWEAIAARLRPYIRRRVATEPDTDDVLQEVLLRMHRGLSTLDDEDRLDAWMYRIARTAVADHRRGRHRHPLVRAPAVTEEPSQPLHEDDDAVARELAQTLSFFVALLPSPYREAITLTELEGRTQREAAEMIGISLSGMKSRVQRGRARLRKMLEDCCEVALDVRGKVIAYQPRPREDLPADCCE